MNILEAKEQIKYAISAYLTKNEHDEYILPIQAQRPIFVMGAPGIGKTEIMKQIAEELSIGMVSYSMTHHTRQSALGLPYIIEKEYGGEKVQVSEYTMSEILATIYDVVEQDGAPEGILFLDEINCVSETLAPSMLQFLQYKVFGKHKVPDGWVIVTAGNPPEHNNSVREFDIVTWDRLKRLDVEPSLEVWQKHAKISGVHPAVIAYLEIKQTDFHKLTTTVDGKRFVTPRGWVDLSKMLQIFEAKGFPVDKSLIAQYLQEDSIARNFAAYYDLFQKYRAAYGIEEILAGKYSATIVERASKAEFDEQLAVITLLIEVLTNGMRDVSHMDQWGLAFGKESMQLRNAKSVEEITNHLNAFREDFAKKRHANSISRDDAHVKIKIISCFEEMITHFTVKKDTVNVTEYSKVFYLEHKQKQKSDLELIQSQISNTLEFTKSAFGDSHSFHLFLQELTTDPVCANFISKYGGETYFKYNKTLLVHDVQKELLEQIDDLELLWTKLDDKNGTK